MAVLHGQLVAQWRPKLAECGAIGLGGQRLALRPGRRLRRLRVALPELPCLPVEFSVAGHHPAGAPTTNTLAETATILGVSNAWLDFSNLIATKLPPRMTLPAEPTSIGQPPEPTDDPFPLGPVTAQLPALYMRHNLADDGTSHTGSLSDSPDIILKNNPVAIPQATYSTAASIASDTEKRSGCPDRTGQLRLHAGLESGCRCRQCLRDDLLVATLHIGHPEFVDADRVCLLP